jgi:hypothetical protein
VEVVRQVRALARRLGDEKREVERLLGCVAAAAAANAQSRAAAKGLTAALPTMERVLRRALLEVEEVWVELDDSFSTRGLARAIKAALGRAKRSRGRAA